ncbi:MAG: hypothetical protein AB7J28_13875 [Hyphomonadaceae bacterium]
MKKGGLRRWALGAAAALGALAAAAPANAVALYWSSVPLATYDRNQCFNYATRAAYQFGMSEIVRTGDEVRGEYGSSVYASMTCIVRGGAATVVIMVAGDTGADARAFRDTLRNYMERAD